MTDARHISLIATTLILLFGTIYSVANHTYLDTSNPLLTHLPHPLHHAHYFASKSNVLNVYFIKQAWAWTSAAFLALIVTSPPSARSVRRFAKWVASTAVWLVFTGWFFGPAVLERVIAASGGECVLVLPEGEVMGVSRDYCFDKTSLSPATHPDLFTTTLSAPTAWHAIPRLRRGHDISGHIFLLTMSILFLSDQLRPSFRTNERWSYAHRWAVGATYVLIGIWLFASYTTSVYFHSPFEKFTGFLLGVASFAITQVPPLESDPFIRRPGRLHQN